MDLGDSGGVYEEIMQLPFSCKAEVALFMHRHCAAENHFFSIFKQPSFVTAIVCCLKPFTALPGDFIITCDDLAARCPHLRRDRLICAEAALPHICAGTSCTCAGTAAHLCREWQTPCARTASIVVMCWDRAFRPSRRLVSRPVDCG